MTEKRPTGLTNSEYKSNTPPSLTSKRRKKNTKTESFPIIGLGGSAGTLDALKTFFGEVSEDYGMAFIVVVHQSKSEKSHLQKLLQAVTPLPVLTAKDNQLLEPNHIYVIPPDKEISIYDGRPQLFDFTEGTTAISIDLFFKSLAQDQGSNSAAIILSGVGSDGSLGLKEIKANNGLALVQDQNSAAYDCMPRNALDYGSVDLVLTPEEMPKRLEHYFFHRQSIEETEPESINKQREWLNKIFALLRTQVGHDFSTYKVNTILRRLNRRMVLNHIDDHDTYIRYMRQNPRETEALFRELLIGVTNFFRDTDSFATLQEKVLPSLFEQLEENGTFRVWVPGCSTGEEVYSLAIILKECLETNPKHIQLQLFGTDIDKFAIEKAREGLFPASICDDVNEERLKKYFNIEGDRYRIRKEIRESIVFSVQNVIKDPPFSHLNLLCCRNLLIYLNGEAQKKLLPLFHYTLKPDGILVLGSSESIGSYSTLFKTLDKKWKIYQKREVPQIMRQFVEFPSGILHPDPPEVSTPPSTTVKRSPDLGQLMQDVVLDQFAPTAILINAKAEILHVLGRTSKYLEAPNGPPTNNILNLAREGLRIALASALRSARASAKQISRKGLTIASNEALCTINLYICPQKTHHTLEGNYLVVFEDGETKASPDNTVSKIPNKEQAESSRIVELERELLVTRESYQTAIEELESSNEELKSTNEEMQSSNEELQSTNEELESSKEELQSLNEELQTVNGELQTKVEELSAAHDDMHNLMNSTEIATIFVDNDMRVRRFTAEASKIVNLIPSDIGRPLKHVMSNLTYGNMIGDLTNVLKSLVPKSVEVQTIENRWYNMRIVPYRTIDNRIDGAVLTFVDIAVKNEDLLKLAKVFMDATDPIIMKDLDGNVLEMNEEAIRLYGWSRDELLHKPSFTVFPKEKQQEAQQLLQRCIQGEKICNVEGLHCNKKGEVFKVLFTLSLLRDHQNEPFGIANITKAL